MGLRLLSTTFKLVKLADLTLVPRGGLHIWRKQGLSKRLVIGRLDLGTNKLKTKW